MAESQKQTTNIPNKQESGNTVNSSCSVSNGSHSHRPLWKDIQVMTTGGQPTGKIYIYIVYNFPSPSEFLTKHKATRMTLFQFYLLTFFIHALTCTSFKKEAWWKLAISRLALSSLTCFSSSHQYPTHCCTANTTRTNLHGTHNKTLTWIQTYIQH